MNVTCCFHCPSPNQTNQSPLIHFNQMMMALVCDNRLAPPSADPPEGKRCVWKSINPATLDPNAIILNPMWQCAVKRDGSQQSRLCCNESKRAAPVLHAIASTWSSCVKMLIQQLFLALCPAEGHKIHGADVQDAHTHMPRHLASKPA